MSNDPLPRSRIAWLAAPALYVVGMLFAFYPVLTSGFRLVPGDLGDARLINYLLEHTYRWVERQPLHADLWSPPFFYPERNVGAYSDIFLSAGPLYWPWRAAGVSPETAFQLCFLLAASLNYLLMYLYARRCLRFPPAVSAFAAFLFAFASPRLVHVVHFQLHLQFYSVLCLYALHRLFEGAEQPEGLGPPLAGRVWTAVFFAGLTAQFYGSFYLGWFFCLGLGVVLLWALTVPDYRRSLLWLLRSYPWSLCLWGGLSALALGDLGRHYLEVVRAMGFQEEHQVLWGMPNAASWISRGPGCWVSFTGLLVSLGVLEKNPWRPCEHALSVGLVAYGLALAAAWRLRKDRLVFVLLAAALTLVVVMTAVWPRPVYGLWRYLHPIVPAGGAIRASGRLVLVLLVPLSLAAAWMLWQLRLRRGLALAGLLAVLCVLEQGQGQPAWDKEAHRRHVAEVARRVPPDSQAFLLVPLRWMRSNESTIHLSTLAMWVQLETGVPTVNGYSGRMPQRWDELDVYSPATADQRRIQAKVKNLCRWLSGEDEPELQSVWLVPCQLEGISPMGDDFRVYVVVDPGPRTAER